MRIFAVIAVIVIHVCDAVFNTLNVRSLDFAIINIFDSLSRFAVPVFVMISGALFLNQSKQIPIKVLYQKYIFRILISFAFWSTVYIVWNWINGGNNGVETFLRGAFHMWYLFAIVGLYLVTPILRQIVKRPDITQYFLMLGFSFSFLLPNILRLPIPYGASFSYIYDKMGVNLVTGYTVYYVLGYFLFNHDFSLAMRKICYALGAVGVALTFIGTELFSLRSGTPFESLYSNFSIGVLLQSVAVFTFFKEKVNMIPSFGVNFLMYLSKRSFGVYLIHILFIQILAIYRIDAMTISPIFAVPIVSTIVLLCSYCSVSILQYLPLIGKHIV